MPVDPPGFFCLLLGMSAYPFPDIPLEDLFNDVLMKTMRGLGIAPRQLAGDLGVSPERLKAVLSGRFEEEIVRRAADALGLGCEALVRLGRGEWKPEKQAPLPGFAMVSTRFGGMSVNACLAWDSSTGAALCFDTGADGRPMLEILRRENLKLEKILLTHAHADHTAAWEPLSRETGATVHAHGKEGFRAAEPFEEGARFAAGCLAVETRLTWGHARGGITYLLRGLDRPLAITGDAIFAGSMGGGAVSFPAALRTNREKIFTLPDETVLCPGHGPVTTVGEEKLNNPFFPEFQVGGSA